MVLIFKEIFNAFDEGNTSCSQAELIVYITRAGVDINIAVC